MAISVVQHEIDTAKIPLVGLEYITEKQRKGLQPVYSCDLCNEYNIIYQKSGNIICHVIHDEHRKNFVLLQEGKLNEYEEILDTMGNKQGSRYLAEKAQEYEEKFGRQKMYIEEIKPSASVQPMQKAGERESFQEHYGEVKNFNEYAYPDHQEWSKEGNPMLKHDNEWSSEEYSHSQFREWDKYDNFRDSKKHSDIQNVTAQNSNYSRRYSEDFPKSRFGENRTVDQKEYFDNENRPMSYVNPTLRDNRPSHPQDHRRDVYGHGVDSGKYYEHEKRSVSSSNENRASLYQGYKENFSNKESMKNDASEYNRHSDIKESGSNVEKPFDSHDLSSDLNLPLLERLKKIGTLLDFIITTDSEALLAENIANKLKQKLLHYKIQTLPIDVEKMLSKALKSEHLVDNILKMETVKSLKEIYNITSMPGLPKPCDEVVGTERRLK